MRAGAIPQGPLAAGPLDGEVGLVRVSGRPDCGEDGNRLALEEDQLEVVSGVPPQLPARGPVLDGVSQAGEGVGVVLHPLGWAAAVKQRGRNPQRRVVAAVKDPTVALAVRWRLGTAKDLRPPDRPFGAPTCLELEVPKA